MYFINESSKLIFYLVETDGTTRCNGLGIRDCHYDSKKNAEKWYQSIVARIDKKHPMYTKALYNLNKLYKIMTDMDDDSEEEYDGSISYQDAKYFYKR